MNSAPDNFRLLAAALLALSPLWALGESLRVRVVDQDGQPIPDVAVFVDQAGVATLTAPTTAVMYQRDSRFEPHVLIVQAGAAVEFPNNDVIAHHVYSFSQPNDFILPLYRGLPPDPVLFEHPGIVTLGCNIHDGMLGFVLVVETDVFGMTDRRGEVVLDVDTNATSWAANAWSPRFRDSTAPMTLTVQPGADDTVVFEVPGKLRPAHDHESGAIAWDDYD